MSELGDKFTAARFGMEKEAQTGMWTGQDLSLTQSQDAQRELNRRLRRGLEEIPQGIQYIRETQKNPPREYLMPGLAAAGAGMGAAYGYRTTPWGLHSTLSPMTQSQLAETVSGALRGADLPTLAAGKKKTLSLAEALTNPKTGLSKKELSNVLGSGSRLYSIPVVGPWLRKRRLAQATKSMTPQLQSALKKVSPERMRAAAKTVASSKPLASSLKRGGLAGIAAMFLPDILRYVGNRIRYGPGGSSVADAQTQLQQRLRQFEADLWMARLMRAEKARAMQAQRLPRRPSFDPFRAYAEEGKPLELPTWARPTV